MRHSPEPEKEQERFIVLSGRTILGCSCGERLVLLGLEDDWRSEREEFVCECGERLTLADRVDEEALYVKELLRGLKVPDGF